MHVAVIDIGKPGKNLGWAMVGPNGADGTDLDDCIDAIARALSIGPVALGFEAPMFVPKRDEVLKLTASRDGECRAGTPNRPYSAGAGAAVLVTALVVVPYVLTRLRDLHREASATLNWTTRLSLPGQLLLFEAFVTNQQRTGDDRHQADARQAATEMERRMSSPEFINNAIEEPNRLNLLGAMMLRTGWSSEIALLSADCLVVRA